MENNRLNEAAVFWCNIPNFGDQLNIDIFNYYGHICNYSRANNAEVAGFGSILQSLPIHFNGAILGSGFMYSECSNLFTNAFVCGVRGQYSKQRIGKLCRPIIGDPGLLVPYLLKDKNISKEYALGFVPHLEDYSNAIIQKMAVNDKNNVLLINVRDSPRKVIEQILKCEVIASSSLHGLVVADAFTIPNIWLQISDKVPGSGFKFFDYYSAFNEEPCAIEISQACSISKICRVAKNRCDIIREVKENLNSLFLKLPEILTEVRERRKNRIQCFYDKVLCRINSLINHTGV